MYQHSRRKPHIPLRRRSSSTMRPDRHRDSRCHPCFASVVVEIAVVVVAGVVRIASGVAINLAGEIFQVWVYFINVLVAEVGSPAGSHLVVGMPARRPVNWTAK
jgi:hypothetical protein